MRLFKQTKVIDERIVNLKNKIYAEVFIIVTIICSLSSIVKYFFLDKGIEDIVTELIILIFSSAYYTYRSMQLGIFSAEVEIHDATSKWPRRKKNLVGSIIGGVVIALIFGINSAVRYGDNLGQSIEYFFMVTFVSLMIYLPFLIITLVIGHDTLYKKSDDVVNKMMINSDSGDENEEH